MRKKRAERRILPLDPKFNDILVSRFINCLQWNGSKSVAQNILYDAMTQIQERTKQEGYEIFRKALFNAQPLIEVRARRVGGATY